MVVWSELHDELYSDMISEMLQFAKLSGTERTRLLAMGERDGFDPMDASFIDTLYQLYLDQSVLEDED